MKKVGICACYNTLNYGSMLQSFATQITIENMGHSSEFIVYKKKATLPFIIKQIPRLLNSNLMFDKTLVLRKKIALKRHPEIARQNHIREGAFQRFSNSYYKKFSPVYFGYEALSRAASEYDSVVVGSDQLWTPGGLASNFYNLMFVPDDVNKVSYATSFGVSEIPWYQKKRTKEYLSRINHLSVREIAGAEIVKCVSGCNAKVVADPTLLLTRKAWDREIPERRMIDVPYIFCYFLGTNCMHRDIAEELQEKTGYSIVSTPHLDSFVERDLQFGDVQLFDVGPDDFVNLIRGAEYVLTDSFHGSVFSILYHKKFITLDRFMDGRQSRNSRIDSLFSMLGLEERRYSKGDIAQKMAVDIDYVQVEQKLNALREESLTYLKDALK